MPTITDPQAILRLRCGSQVDTGERITLTVHHRENVVGLVTVPDATRRGGTRITDPGVAECVTLTQDGRRYDRDGWNPVNRQGELVYVERWNADGRIFHGWIDATTRKLVQAG